MKNWYFSASLPGPHRLQMGLAARRHFLAKQIDRASQLVEEPGLGANGHVTRVLAPDPGNSAVNRTRLRNRFAPDTILS